MINLCTYHPSVVQHQTSCFIKIRSITLDASRMLDDGIMLEVEIMPSINIIKQMGYGRKEIPTIKAKAIIDTGAKCSVVDKELLTHLPQQPCISTQVATPFHTVNAEVHNLIFKIPGQNEYFPVQAIVADFSQYSHKALIGRDFLQYCTLIYEGATNKAHLLITN